jgi:hypothetical protein
MFIRRVAACGLALLLAGCLSESVNPVTPPEEAIEAPELLGLWQTPVEDATIYAHALRGDGYRLQIVTVSHEKDGSGEVDAYIGHVSEVDGRRFVNLQTADTTDEPLLPYSILGYEIGADGALTVRFLSTDTLAAAVAAGHLTGEVETDSFGTMVRLAGTGTEIAAFLAAADPATLFDRAMLFRRVEP